MVTKESRNQGINQMGLFSFLCYISYEFWEKEKENIIHKLENAYVLRRTQTQSAEVHARKISTTHSSCMPPDRRTKPNVQYFLFRASTIFSFSYFLPRENLRKIGQIARYHYNFIIKQKFLNNFLKICHQAILLFTN